MRILPLILRITRIGCPVNSLFFEYYFNGLICLVGLLVACLIIKYDRTVVEKWNKITFNSRPFWYVGSSFLTFVASPILKSNFPVSNLLDNFRMKSVKTKTRLLTYVILFNQSVLQLIHAEVVWDKVVLKISSGQALCFIFKMPSKERVLRPFQSGPSVFSLGLWSNEFTKGGHATGNRGQKPTTLHCWHQSKHPYIAVAKFLYLNVLKIKACIKSFSILQNIKFLHCKLNQR